jgi:hypothetical protein
MLCGEFQNLRPRRVLFRIINKHAVKNKREMRMGASATVILLYVYLEANDHEFSSARRTLTQTLVPAIALLKTRKHYTRLRAARFCKINISPPEKWSTFIILF